MDLRVEGRDQMSHAEGIAPMAIDTLNEEAGDVLKTEERLIVDEDGNEKIVEEPVSVKSEQVHLHGDGFG